MKRLILAALFAIITVSPVNAQSTLALQDRCNEGAKKLEHDKLNQPYPHGVANPCTSFQNHYNKKRDKCFMRIGYYFGQDRGDDGRNHPSYGVGLYDVFESSKPLGELYCFGFEVKNCYVGNKQCKTVDEFETLIKPYMED